MIRNRKIRVTPDDAGTRLDVLLARRLPSSARTLVADAIRKGKVRVNGRTARKGIRVAAGDEVAVSELLETADWRAMPHPGIRIPVIHEDPDLLVINKPAGLPANPLDPAQTATVVSGLLARYPELASVGDDPLFPAVVHRLDTETSGVMLAARNDETYGRLRALFATRRVAKRYVALVCGSISRAGRLEHRLAHARGGSHRMVVARGPAEGRKERPMRAVTEYAVRRRFAAHTLLDVTIRTGVTHQIRCQLAAAGHPVAGDRLYGSRDDDAGYAGRLFLHASEIAFPHPRTGRTARFAAPLPAELEAALRDLAARKV